VVAGSPKEADEARGTPPAPKVKGASPEAAVIEVEPLLN